jgi:TorA maturation chaperone TorD
MMVFGNKEEKQNIVLELFADFEEDQVKLFYNKLFLGHKKAKRLHFYSYYCTHPMMKTDSKLHSSNDVRAHVIVC